MTIAATFVTSCSERRIVPAPSLFVDEVGFQERVGLGAVGQDLGDLVLEAEHAGGAEVLGVVARPARLVVDLGLIGELDPDRHEVADARGALVLEEGAGSLPPQRVRGEGDRLRVGHRQAHRLVARLRGRILDRRQGRRLADIREPVGGAAGAERRRSNGETGEPGGTAEAIRKHGRELSQGLGVGAARRASGPGVAADTATLPGETTVACRLFFDWTLRTEIVSPCAPASVARALKVRVMPGTS